MALRKTMGRTTRRAKDKSLQVLFRVDASRGIGSGHVMRCLALAEEIRFRGGDALFLSCDLPGPLRARVEAEGVRVIDLAGRHPDGRDLQQLLKLAEDCKASWVVLDGYGFDAEYQRTIRDAGHRVMVLDDYGHLPEYNCDLLLNQNLGAEEIRYRTNSDATRLLGPKYALLRHEFTAACKRLREVADCGERVLVIFGGGDPFNVTTMVLERLRELQLQVRVVAGPLNSDWKSLRRKVAQIEKESPGLKLEFLREVSRMADLMLWADLAITAAGSTCWELACLGVPMLTTPVAPNQAGVARALENAGLAYVFSITDESQLKGLADRVVQLLAAKTVRKKLSLRLRSIVDGLGSARVASYLSTVNG